MLVLILHIGFCLYTFFVAIIFILAVCTNIYLFILNFSWTNLDKYRLDEKGTLPKYDPRRLLCKIIDLKLALCLVNHCLALKRIVINPSLKSLVDVTYAEERPLLVGSTIFYSIFSHQWAVIGKISDILVTVLTIQWEIFLWLKKVKFDC